MRSVGRRIRIFPEPTSCFSSALLLLRLLSMAIRVSGLLTRMISQSYTSGHNSTNNQGAMRRLTFPLFDDAGFHRHKSLGFKFNQEIANRYGPNIFGDVNHRGPEDY